MKPSRKRAKKPAAAATPPPAPPPAEPSSASSPAAPAGPEAPSSPAPPPLTAPALQRVVGLPARPRLRVSFGWVGDKLTCEAQLMDERRELLRRSNIPADDPHVSGIFAYFATMLVNELRASGVLVAASSSASGRPTPARELAPRRPGFRSPSSSKDDAPPPASSSEETPPPAPPASSSSSEETPPPAPPASDDDAPATPRG